MVWSVWLDNDPLFEPVVAETFTSFAKHLQKDQTRGLVSLQHARELEPHGNHEIWAETNQVFLSPSELFIIAINNKTTEQENENENENKL